jgi:FKBP-type peptidyl-prolyl cis-trans isomerase 2
MHKTIEIVFGYTNISKELSDKIKGKEKGFSFEFKQSVDSKPMVVEFTYDTFDEDTIELMKKDKEIELEINKFWYPFKVIKINEDDNKIVLEYEDPLVGKNVLHKIKIVDVESLKNGVKDERKKEKK